MEKIYSWGIDGIYKADAEEVGKELEKIDAIEDITADSVLNYAKIHRDSAISSMLEWDDAIAGEKYRKSQCAKIITAIKVEIIKNEDEKTKPIRAFVQTKKLESYQPIEVMISDTNRYQLLLEKAYKELNSVKTRYDELTEIQELLKDIPEY